MNPKWIQKVGRKNITDSSLYYYVSDDITSPFKPVDDIPIVKGSEKSRLYGTNFFPDPDEPQELIAYGWDYTIREFEISPPRLRGVWYDNSIEIV